MNTHVALPMKIEGHRYKTGEGFPDVYMVFYRPDTDSWYYDISRAVANQPMSGSVLENLKVPTTPKPDTLWYNLEATITEITPDHTLWVVTGPRFGCVEYQIKNLPPLNRKQEYALEMSRAEPRRRSIALLQSRIAAIEEIARATNNAGIGVREQEDLNLYRVCLQALQELA